MRWLAFLAVVLASPAHAEGDLPGGPPLDAKGFDAVTLGKRMDTYNPNLIYGVEEFLPGQRSLWRDGDGCVRATWEQVGDQICFTYENHPDSPDCWVYNLVEGELWGWYQGRPEGPAVRLIAGSSAMDCGWIGS